MKTHAIDFAAVRNQFPLLKQTVNDHPLVYLDSSATSQKPDCVIRALKQYYEMDNANVHRGVYELSARATAAFEQSRTTVKTFLNAAHTHEIIFVRGATEAINLVAQSYGRSQFQPGDEIIISAMEHHSNIVPWQLLSEQSGTLLRVNPITDRGEIDMAAN